MLTTADTSSRGNNKTPASHVFTSLGLIELHGLAIGSQVSYVSTGLYVFDLVLGGRSCLEDEDLEVGIGLRQTSGYHAGRRSPYTSLETRVMGIGKKTHPQRK